MNRSTAEALAQRAQRTRGPVTVALQGQPVPCHLVRYPSGAPGFLVPGRGLLPYDAPELQEAATAPITPAPPGRPRAARPLDGRAWQH